MKYHRSPPKRSHMRRETPQDAPRILSHEEKHELIRAHAATRHKRPKGYGLGYYIAVAASFLIVATGWVMTLDRGLWEPAKGPDSAIQELADSVERIKREIDKTSEKIQNAKKQLEAATATSTNPR